MDPDVPADSSTELLPAEPLQVDLKLTPTQIGADWGISRAYASKKIKEGCPTSSYETARAWRLSHAQCGVGYRSKPKNTNGEAKEPPVETAQVGTRGGKETVGGRGVENQSEAAKTDQAPPPECTAIEDELHSIEQSLRDVIGVEKKCHAMVEEAQRAGDAPRLDREASA